MFDVDGFHYSSLPVAIHTLLDYGTIPIKCMALLMGVDSNPISEISPLHCLLVSSWFHQCRCGGCPCMGPHRPHSSFSHLRCGPWLGSSLPEGTHGFNAALIPSGVQILSSFLLSPRMYGRHRIFGVVIKCGFWVRWRRLVGEHLLYQVCGKTIGYI